MYQNHKRTKRGFTLLEVLLVIAAIGILASIVLVAINPNKQITQVRDAVRKAYVNTIRKAIEQYSIDNGGQYPTGIASGSYKDICPIGQVTGQCADLSALVPNYLSSIPVDPTGSNYKVGVNPNNNTISVWSDKSESIEVAVNKFATAVALAAGAKDPSFDTGIPVGFNSIVQTIALQSDGKILVGGSLLRIRDWDQMEY